jgi:hypothetical protein
MLPPNDPPDPPLEAATDHDWLSEMKTRGFSIGDTGCCDAAAV